MLENLEVVLALARQVWRQRWLCLAVAWPLALLGWAAVLLLPSQYESSARIFADTESLLTPLMKDMTVKLEQAEQLEVMQRTLLSRPNLAQVAAQTPLKGRATDPIAAEGLVSHLAEEIDVTADGHNLFRVTYRDQDSAIAAAVVRSLLEIFIASNLNANRKEMESARRFIEQQIRAQETAERRLADFQKANVDFLPGETGYFGRLQQARAETIAARGDLEGARARRDALRQQLRAVPATATRMVLPFQAGPTLAPDSPAGQLQALERRLGELRNRYTERHPDVEATKRAIGALRQRLPSAGNPGESSFANPLHEQIRLQLVQVEAEIGSLESRLGKADRLVDELSGLARVMPEAEAEYKRLVRDYEVIKKNYEDLVAKRESVRIAGDLTNHAERAAFRIIDPPAQSLTPVAPPRLLLLAAALLLSIAAGVGLALARAFVTRPFESARELQRAYGLPVAGSLSEVATRAGWTRRSAERLAFISSCVGLLLTFLAIAGLGGSQLTCELRAAPIQTSAGGPAI